jgi:hypothetical protein
MQGPVPVGDYLIETASRSPMLAYHSTVGHLRQSAATLTHGRCSGRAAHGNSDPPLPDPSTNHAPAPTPCFPLQHCLGLGADVSLRPWTAPSRRSMRHAVTAARSRHHGPDVVPPRVAPGLVAGQGPFLRGQGCAQSRDEESEETRRAAAMPEVDHIELITRGSHCARRASTARRPIRPCARCAVSSSPGPGRSPRGRTVAPSARVPTLWVSPGGDLRDTLTAGARVSPRMPL